MKPKPVIARVDDGRTILDLRTVEPADDALARRRVAGARMSSLFVHADAAAGDVDPSPDAVSTWLPTDLARGPWDPGALHGGPVAALLARAAEPLLEPLQPVRLTVELLRPVPMDVFARHRSSRPRRTQDPVGRGTSRTR